MKLMAICMTVILAVGYLTGGRLRNLADLQIRWPALAFVGLSLQFVTGPGETVPLACLYLSFVLLIGGPATDGGFYQAMVDGLQRAEAEMEKATANLPSPTYPKR